MCLNMEEPVPTEDYCPVTGVYKRTNVQIVTDVGL
jgi:hypothetical protein